MGSRAELKMDPWRQNVTSQRPNGFGVAVGTGVAVFSRLHEEIEANPYDVCDAIFFCRAGDVVCEDVVEDRDWEGFDTLSCRVCSSVAA